MAGGDGWRYPITFLVADKFATFVYQRASSYILPTRICFFCCCCCCYWTVSIFFILSFLANLNDIYEWNNRILFSSRSDQNGSFDDFVFQLKLTVLLHSISFHLLSEHNLTGFYGAFVSNIRFIHILKLRRKKNVLRTFYKKKSRLFYNLMAGHCKNVLFFVFQWVFHFVWPNLLHFRINFST